MVVTVRVATLSCDALSYEFVRLVFAFVVMCGLWLSCERVACDCLACVVPVLRCMVSLLSVL